MLFICIRVPHVRLLIRSYVDFSGFPLSHTAFDFNFHFVPVEEFEQVRELKLGTSVIVEQGDCVSFISVEVLATCMYIDAFMGFMDFSAFSCTGCSVVNDNLRFPLARFLRPEIKLVNAFRVSDVLSEVLGGDFGE